WDTGQPRTGTTENWRADRNLVVSFSGEGRFEIRGISHPTRYRVAMRSGGQMDFLPVDPVEFAPGQKDGVFSGICGSTGPWSR
ncbi:MAG: hypothetical protein ACE1Z0_00775, partial [Acidimicrobiia bacterium]